MLRELQRVRCGCILGTQHGVAGREPRRASGPGHSGLRSWTWSCGSENVRQGTDAFRSGLLKASVAWMVELNGKGRF